MKKLYGVTVAMTTPMDKNGVNLAATADLTEKLIAHGVNCLYPCGTTGEMLKLRAEERMQIAETIVKTARGRVPVFIHAGAATPQETLTLTEHAHRIGADGVGIVSPQFFTCNPREMIHYYDEIASRLPEDFPIYLYCIPQCAANDITPDIAKTLHTQHKNIVGIKYSFTDMQRTTEYLDLAEDFSVLHGCDRLFSSMLILGCDGTVSGISGIVPEPFVNVYQAYLKNDLARVQYWQKACREVCDILHGGSNMAYFKSGLELRGVAGGCMRAPQLDLLKEEREQLEKAMTAFLNRYEIPLKL